MHCKYCNKKIVLIGSDYTPFGHHWTYGDSQTFHYHLSCGVKKEHDEQYHAQI